MVEAATVGRIVGSRHATPQGVANARNFAHTLAQAGLTIVSGLALGVDYAATTSCYDPAPDGAACGHCDACLLRLRGFAEHGMDDPAPYAPGARP